MNKIVVYTTILFSLIIKMNIIPTGDIMNLINRLDRLITDKNYKIIIKENSINIINFIEIKDLSTNKIVINNYKGTTTIIGENLVVSKMQDNEVLIAGKIKTIELVI